MDPATLYLTLPGNGGPDLEALWLGDGARVAIAAPPHPLMGGEMGNPVVRALAAGLVLAGYRCLLFNFRGVGDSEGDPSGDPADALADYRAAIAAVDPSMLAVVSGYSFGGATAIRAAAALPSVRAIAVAPPPAMLDAEDVARVAARLSVVAGEHDGIASPGDLRPLLGEAAESSVHVIRGADHFFGGFTDAVHDLAEELSRDGADERDR